MAKMIDTTNDGKLVKFQFNWTLRYRWEFDRSPDQYIIHKDNKLGGI